MHPTSPSDRQENVTQEAAPAPVSPYFTALAVDDDPELLDASYRLRYQVYCLERQFLPAANYPDEREIDSYDSNSVHVSVINKLGETAATARLIELTEAGLPLLDHCRLFADERP